MKGELKKGNGLRVTMRMHAPSGCFVHTQSKIARDAPNETSLTSTGRGAGLIWSALSE